MTRPDFHTLPGLPGRSDLRFVDGRLIDEEEYRVVGYRVRQVYTVEHPHVPGCLQQTRQIPVWEATLDGLRRYSALVNQRRTERKAAWQAREEADDEFREYVDSLHDAKPGGYGT